MLKQPARPRRYIQVADYCARVVSEGGLIPSYNQICKALRISHRGTVRRYVMQAEAKGLLIRAGHAAGGMGSKNRRLRLGRPDEAEAKTIQPGYHLN